MAIDEPNTIASRAILVRATTYTHDPSLNVFVSHGFANRREARLTDPLLQALNDR